MSNLHCRVLCHQGFPCACRFVGTLFAANSQCPFFQSVQAYRHLGHFFASSLTSCDPPCAKATNDKTTYGASPRATLQVITGHIGSCPLLPHNRLWITLSWFESMRGSHLIVRHL